MTSQIRVDEITNRSGLGTVTIYDNGFEFTGVTTFTEDVDITGGLTIGGVLTYEDVTNIDSVGVVTARAGIRVTGDSIHVESSEDRLLYLKSTDANAYLTFEDTDSSSAFANRVGTVSDGLYFSTGGGGERLRITSDGKVGVGENSPDRLLHLKAASSTAYSGGSDTADYNFLKIENTTNDKSAGIFFAIGSNGEAAITATEVADGNTDIAFQNRGGGVRSEKARIDSSGNVQARRARSNTVGDVALSVQPSDSTIHYGMRIDSTNNSLNLDRASGTPTNLLVIDSSGDLGLGGITSPSFTTGGGIHLKRNYGIGFGDGSNGRPDFQLVTTGGSTLDFRCGFGADTADISMTTGGNLVFASGGGIDFSANANANGMTSEVLDDYEEGTYTPTLTNTGASPIYQYQQGRYTKVGRYVIAQGIIGVTNNNTFSGSVSISIPFSSSSAITYGQCGPVADGSGFGNISSQFGTMVGASATAGTLVIIANNAALINYSQLANAWYIRFNFMYEAV